MADKTIHDLTALIALASGDELAIFDIDEPGVKTKRMTLATLRDWLGQNGLLAASQSQAAATPNGLWGVKDRDLTSPPAGPADRDRYLVATGATGDWAGHSGEIATWDASLSQWVFAPFAIGDSLWVEDEDKFFANDDSGLIEITQRPLVPSDLQNLDYVGINATADATTRLHVRAKGVRFDNEGTDPIDVQINRTATTDDAYLTFEQNVAPQWRIGQWGSVALTVKRTTDGGTNWDEVFSLDNATGQWVFPAAAPFTIQSAPVVLKGYDAAKIKMVRAASTDEAGIECFTGAVDTGAGFRLTNDNNYSIKLETTTDGTTWAKVLYVDGAGWHSPPFDWDVSRISVKPASGDATFEVVKMSATKTAAIRLIDNTTGGGAMVAVDATGDTVFSTSDDGTFDEVFHFSKANQRVVAPASGNVTFEATTFDVTKAGGAAIRLSNDSDQSGLDLSITGGKAEFNYGATAARTPLWKLNLTSGKLETEKVTFTGTNTAIVAEGTTAPGIEVRVVSDGVRMDMAGVNPVFSTTNDGTTWVPFLTYNRGTQTFEMTQPFKVDAPSASMNMNGGTFTITGKLHTTGDVTLDANLSVGGTFTIGSEVINRASSAAAGVITWKTANADHYRLGENAGTTLATFSGHNGSSWFDFITFNRANGDITFNKTPTHTAAPVLRAVDTTTRNFGANTEEDLLFTDVKVSQAITVAATHDVITFDEPGSYMVSVTVRTVSQTANDTGEWYLSAGRVGSSDILNCEETDRWTPNDHAATGKKESHTFTFTATVAASDAMRLKVKGISANADLEACAVNIVRGF